MNLFRCLLAVVVTVGLVLLCVLAGFASQLPVKRQDTAHYWFPGETQNGPRDCTELDPNTKEGTWTYCKNCTNPSDPKTCCTPANNHDPLCGAFCYKEVDRWRCASQGGGGGQCVCLPDGSACVNDVDCCSASCINGVCAPSACVQLGGVCTDSGQCCSGFCLDGTCQTAGGGACSCVADGLPCVQNVDCCSASCINGVCGPGATTTTTIPACACVALGQACTFSGECCEGFCTDGVCTTAGTGGGCAAAAATCAVDSDCCSGICAQTKCATETCDRLDPALPDDTDYEWWTSPAAGTTLLDAMCYCQGTCGSSIDIRFFNRANNPIAIAGPFPPVLVCTSSSADSPFIPFDNTDVNRILTLGEGVRVSMDSLSSGVDRIRWCVRHAP